VSHAIHGPLVERFIESQWQNKLTSGTIFPNCGLVVDATVQKRGRPAGLFADAKKYFSGKHWIYCLKSQVLTNREGIAMHVVAGVPGSVHDLKLFKEHEPALAELIEHRAQGPTGVLADKGYCEQASSHRLQLVTPVKKPPNAILAQDHVRYNQRLASARIVVENFFGRLAAKFKIMVREWAFDDAYYRTIFEICCALVNFDIQHGSGGRLTGEDGGKYARMISKVCGEAKAAADMSANKARERRIERRERIAAQIRPGGQEDD
jgi:hypothetical protein